MHPCIPLIQVWFPRVIPPETLIKHSHGISLESRRVPSKVSSGNRPTRHTAPGIRERKDLLRPFDPVDLGVE